MAYFGQYQTEQTHGGAPQANLGPIQRHRGKTGRQVPLLARKPALNGYVTDHTGKPIAMIVVAGTKGFEAEHPAAYHRGDHDGAHQDNLAVHDRPQSNLGQPINQLRTREVKYGQHPASK